MATEHLYTNMGMCDIFHELELCPDEILTILQTRADKYNNNTIFSVAAVPPTGPLIENSVNGKNKRKKPAKAPSSSSSQGFRFDDDSDEDHAMLPRRESVKKQKVSPSATSTEDGSGEDGKIVSHISVERNRRKQMNEHLAELRQLMPSFYVKKGDQASIVGGVIDYINELHQVLQSLEAKKQRKLFTNEVGWSPRINAASPRLLVPHKHSNLSPPIPRTPKSTSPYKTLIKQHLVQPSSITSPTSNLYPSYSSVADTVMMMNSYNNTCNNNAIANELVASSKSSVANVDVKFCSPNLELRTLSSKFAGQTMKIVSAIEDLALEILQVSINTVEDTMLNAFTIKIGIECQLSAEELAQHIQQTFCRTIFHKHVHEIFFTEATKLLLHFAFFSIFIALPSNLFTSDIMYGTASLQD